MGSLLPSIASADKILDHRRTGGPTQDMFLVLQQAFFADQSAVLLHVTRLKGGARELKLDFLRALLGDHKTQVHVVLGERKRQDSEEVLAWRSLVGYACGSNHLNEE